MYRKRYTPPTMRVADVEVNDGLLADIVSNGNASGSLGTEVKGEIDFDEMNGTDIVRKNPWESQW